MYGREGRHFIMKFKKESTFVDVDTGEVLPYYRAEQLKYTEYIITSFKENYNYEREKGKCIIERTNFCRHTGQRAINF